jgi:negative regulator of sigma E activity
MKKIILKITALSLFAAAVVAAPTPIRAQDGATNAPAAASDQPAPAKHKKHDHAAFNGKLTAVDTNAMTLTVGTRTFEITSETKITKDTLPATLEDGVVGETAAGTYKKSADGKLTATSIRFGANADGEKKKKKKMNPESTGSSTNSVPN